MSTNDESIKTALVLPGGGARGAFQVGVLKAISELLPKGAVNPFQIISGTSAGAVTSIVLAAKARRFRHAVAELEDVWGNFRCHDVYKTDHLTLLMNSLRWFGAMVTGGLISMPSSLLDNSPLRALLSRNVRFPRIQLALDHGWLDAIAVTAAGYSTAQSHTFFQATPEHNDWTRTRRVGVREDLHLDHVMASIAVPMIFPPVRMGGEYFGDGAMRQATPLSPAIHLGAERILVLGVRNEVADKAPAPGTKLDSPSIAQIAGYMLDTLFMDGLYSDLERMTRINQIIDSVPEEHRTGTMQGMRAIDTMIIVPSEDVRNIAYRHHQELPMALRALLRGIGGKQPRENRLISYLLFEQNFTREMIDLGYRDAMNVKTELLDFVSGADVPRLFAPSWVKQDLSEAT